MSSISIKSSENLNVLDDINGSQHVATLPRNIRVRTSPGHPEYPPLVIDSISLRPALGSAVAPGRNSCNFPVVLLHEIRRSLLDPRHRHHIVCSRNLQRNIHILSDFLALLDNDINGTPITPIPPSIQPRRRALLASISVKLQRILDSMQFYKAALRPTPIRSVWRRVFAQSGYLDLAVRMIEGMVIELMQICRKGSKLVINQTITLDTTLELQVSPFRPHSAGSTPHSGRRRVPRVSSPLADHLPPQGAILSRADICESPEVMEASWRSSPHSPEVRSPCSATSSLSMNNSTTKLLTTDKLIAVMGPTGAGKSTLINIALGKTIAEVSDRLESCTQEVRAFRCPHPSEDGGDVVFIDTPGFDDTYRSDTDILESIANWLNTTHQRGIMLSGILYLHRLSDNRFAGTPLRNLSIFNKLCGPDALKNVVLVTTMGEDLDDSIKNPRISQLREEYWQDMIKHGSRVIGFDQTPRAVWDIVDGLGVGRRRPVPLQLPIEMVDQGKSLYETSAGSVLLGWLESLVKELGEMIRRLEAQIRRRPGRSSSLRDTTQNGASESSLVLAEKLNLETQQRDATLQMDKLRSSPARRLTNKIREKVQKRVGPRRWRTLPLPLSTLDTRLAPSQKSKLIATVEGDLRSLIEWETVDSFPEIHESLQSTWRILDIVKNSEISCHIIVRLLQDITTVFSAVMEKRKAQGLRDPHVLDILKHTKEDIDKATDMILRVAPTWSGLGMGLDDYKILLTCQKVVKETFDALEVDCDIHSFSSILSARSTMSTMTTRSV